MRALRIAAHVEAVSLVALLLNLATWHAQPVSSLLGPLHGTAYLVAIATAWSIRGADAAGARWRALIPGVGGLLAVRCLRDRPRPAGATEPVTGGTKPVAEGPHGRAR
ncbi:hypothetical protein [Streptomyces sp. NPDC005955]|uniref:hypothetical protein n=1 Tax=Streptomyces sp. NPDC005955 TaxID=3364738 RepID=UPI00367D88D4